MQEETFWSAKETNKNTSFYSIRSSWYSSFHQTAQNANAQHLLYTREPLGDTHWAAAQHILPSTQPPGQMLLEQDTFPAWEKSSCQLQPPVPYTAPLALGPSHHREQLLSWQAQAQAQMHKGVMSSTGWPTCRGWKSKWESQNHHPLEGMLWEGVCTCLAVQVPSLPQRGLPWITQPSTPVEELAPSGTGIISLQCAALELVIHPLKYSITADHNTASWWKMTLLSMKWNALPSKQKTLVHINGEDFSNQKHFSSFCHHYKS